MVIELLPVLVQEHKRREMIISKEINKLVLNEAKVIEEMILTFVIHFRGLVVS